MRLAAALLCIVTHIGTVNANVEKTVFLGPSPVTLQNVRPGLDNLRLDILTPSDTVLPTHLRVQFPTESLPRGLESWYLLRQLDGARRYEVRICWPATQPTDFWLETFSLAQVFDTPELVSSLAKYSEQRQFQGDEGRDVKGAASETPESVLFLRLQAAASYYSTNRTLMDYPPPVDADIILDPFVLNVFPESLGPVAIYIVAVAIGAYFLSAYIYNWLLAIAAEPPSKPHTD
ncbi:hypothetical protein PtrSN002B_007641 [Pyrenophora tritici-repentis]|uniref:TT-ORF1 domain containing protein n=2 Tax=Pyrenophora tritici-repentis TaxID=45151 RepID=A0A2W1GYZ9_9PLEO|nr:uncharacterized protein PTRG_03480 [Pyrenophora tritici-repentis Pt-1C-BFP]KAA8620488.1 hypothetical protein PtrV1_07582 [Pyrenophora tritici-repentis]EDU46318.1 conserved hypothetical protein [Pyrenophora tritici-repentis Pt-1C-BFP]KAF7448635.1 hypothetical protein A1F99_079990 [Pyrenophora tritici-repentis]KAF7572358.1 TT-ORF1 domain containing protein [Pyrenophora tritici-repentis]KAG9384462.1 hypothetical protein A1F94_004009 [Pyrenophora tritici-repentis]